MISNILIITENMMPFSTNWGGCQRVYHYAKKMLSAGIPVTVICHNDTIDRIDGIENLEGITVIGSGGRKTLPTPSEGSSSSVGLKAKIRKQLQSVDRNVKLVSLFVRFIYRFLYSEPNVLAGHISKKWANSILPLVVQHINDKKIDTVILSGPNFGAFYHAKTIKATGVKIILDFRDPWISWYEKPTLASRAEKKAIDCADLVITTTEPLTSELNRKYKTTKCHTIMNGYDKTLWSTIKQPVHNPETLLISYIGIIVINSRSSFQIRNPSCFIRTALFFMQSHPDIKIRFIGVKDDLSSIPQEFKEHIEFRNRVSVADSLRFTAEADVLLMFHNAHDPSGKYIICGKAFDCMRSGNYLLSIGDDAYANKAFVEKNGIGIHCNNNQKSILNALEKIYDMWKKNGLSNMKPNIEQFSRDYQNTQFLQLLKEIAE